MKVLDTKNCSTGSDKQIPPQELFTRLGTERYTKVSVQETDANGNTVTNVAAGAAGAATGNVSGGLMK